MKKLELNQMENLNGGKISGRNCLFAGASVAVGVIAGGAAAGAVAIGWYSFAGASWLTGIAGDCF